MRPPKGSSKGLWLACETMEASALTILSKELVKFESPIRKCYECGVQAPTLVGKRQRRLDMLLAALFLKKALSDLRSIWILLRFGYTSQAASVAASLYENALTVVAVAGNTHNALKLGKSKSGDVPWDAQQFAKVLAQKWRGEADARREKFDQRDYDSGWRQIYSGYKWLCKIKHPTVKSAIHDASATSLTEGEYVVMAAPDVRLDDLVVKATILAIAISRVHGAVRHFAIALECDASSTEYEKFSIRMDGVLREAQEAYKEVATQPLPFDVGDSAIAKDYSRLKEPKQ